MVIRTAEFIKSSPSLSECPESTLPEYAFIGRSNVGKSSLINMITGHGKLAKISGTPGKTQLINHFLINDSWYLTDLPGFGFAKVPLKIKRKWDNMIRNFLLKRSNLVCSFLLIDIRHEPQKNDLDFMAWMAGRQIPFYIVFTKADKLSHNQRQSAVAQYMKVLSEQWEPLPPHLVTSSEANLGRGELLALIESFNQSYVAEGLG